MKISWQKYCFYVLIMLFVASINVEKTFALEFKVITSTGLTLTVKAEPEDSIADIKIFVSHVTRIPPGNQRMFKGNVELKPSNTLASYNIKDGDSINIKLGTGGMKTEDTKSGGLLKIMILFILVVIISFFIIKKKISSEPVS